MVTVKKLLHEIFTEDTIKVLAIGFAADDPRTKSNKPGDMSISEYSRITSSNRIFERLNDTKENREKFKKAIYDNNLREDVICGRGMTETESFAAKELIYTPRWM